MVTLTHLKKQGGATTHHTHDLSTRERISQRLENLVQVANSTQEFMLWHSKLGYETPKSDEKTNRNCYVTDMANRIGPRETQIQREKSSTDFIIPMMENVELDFLFSCKIPPYVTKRKKGHIFDLLPS